MQRIGLITTWLER